jgi:hypothetical protein
MGNIFGGSDTAYQAHTMNLENALLLKPSEMIINVITATKSRKIDDCKVISPDLVPLLVNRISNYFNYQQVAIFLIKLI